MKKGPILGAAGRRGAQGGGTEARHGERRVMVQGGAPW